MSTPRGNIIPLISKRFLKRATASTSTSRVMRHVVKETAKMATDEEKPNVKEITPKVHDKNEVH